MAEPCLIHRLSGNLTRQESFGMVEHAVRNVSRKCLFQQLLTDMQDCINQFLSDQGASMLVMGNSVNKMIPIFDSSDELSE